MQIFDQSLSDLTRKNWIAQSVAEEYTEDVDALRRMIKGKAATGDGAGLIG
jgi:hypothetical protein